ncbi:MAG TPA: glycosyl hydrolase-related protein [Anaerolineales bacterium]|nr:glycosyl hydrolase-related protein [Anaerolineales bacterium]
MKFHRIRSGENREWGTGEAWETNLLEEDETALAVEGGGVRLQVRPFQILTVRLVPAG